MKRAIVVTVVVAVVALACADTRRERSLKERLAAQAAAAAPKATTLAPVEPETAFCADTLESAAMRCAEGVATRSGDTIILRLTTVGGAKRVDNPAEGAAYRRYY